VSAPEAGDGRVRSLLAETARAEYAPRRNLASGAVKRLRLRRHAVVQANEFFAGFAGLIRGLVTLWSADREPSDRRRSDRDA